MEPTIDRSAATEDLNENQLQLEFNELEEVAKSPGFGRFIRTMRLEYEQSLNALFSDELTVVDIKTFFLREETFATAKVLRRYITLVDERRADLHEQLETNQRERDTK